MSKTNFSKLDDVIDINNLNDGDMFVFKIPYQLREHLHDTAEDQA